MSPDWTGNPQHFVAGLVLASVLAVVARRWMASWVAVLLGISLACMAEGIIEVLEWRFLFEHTTRVSSYYDTIADIGVTTVGAVVGGACAGFAFVVRSCTRGRR